MALKADLSTRFLKKLKEKNHTKKLDGQSSAIILATISIETSSVDWG